MYISKSTPSDFSLRFLHVYYGTTLSINNTYWDLFWSWMYIFLRLSYVICPNFSINFYLVIFCLLVQFFSYHFDSIMFRCPDDRGQGVVAPIGL